MTIWKKTTQPFQTIGTPPRIGSTIRATIGSTRNSNSPLANIVAAKSGTTIDRDAVRVTAAAAAARSSKECSSAVGRRAAKSWTSMSARGCARKIPRRLRASGRWQRPRKQGPGSPRTRADVRGYKPETAVTDSATASRQLRRTDWRMTAASGETRPTPGTGSRATYQQQHHTYGSQGPPFEMPRKGQCPYRRAGAGKQLNPRTFGARAERAHACALFRSGPRITTNRKVMDDERGRWRCPDGFSPTQGSPSGRCGARRS